MPTWAMSTVALRERVSPSCVTLMTVETAVVNFWGKREEEDAL